ncbi:alginate lyase family protein [uncultured Polaribacter sp.]|uniref:alginate lyase family protein n=1 Tax=uncultured Polaribacter sp. TaxID=174711 RepID=UPI00259BB817|nr:alginate lyase family protein [uncultured Polaribacter sp.]
MNSKIGFFEKLTLVLFISIYGCSSIQNNINKVSIIDYESLETQKSLIKKGDKKVVEDYNKLITKANKLLKVDGFSVTKKTGVPPSKNKHDYMSIGPYWWPNPKTESGLPYVRKDGEINPETRNNFTDFVEKDNFFSAVKTLKDAFFYSDDKKYANKNIAFINTWFLEETTKMNPNVNFGQYVPGKSEGRCFGIIEFDDLIEVVKFLELARDKNILSKEIENGMFNWFLEYSNWLKNSKLGIEESTRKNNHATHYDVQLLSILVYLNKIEEVKNYLSTTTKARIFSQIEPDGSQPLELARTKSFSYSVMNLHGFLELASIGQKVSVDLWNLSSKDGSSIKKGYQYMLPYITNKKEWEHKQIKDRTSSEVKLIADFKLIKVLFKDNSFDKAIQFLEKRKTTEQ